VSAIDRNDIIPARRQVLRSALPIISTPRGAWEEKHQKRKADTQKKGAWGGSGRWETEGTRTGKHTGKGEPTGQDQGSCREVTGGGGVQGLG